MKTDDSNWWDSDDWFAKLKDPRWWPKRDEILERDEYQCCDCGREARYFELHVHHLVYHRGRDPWEYDNDDLVTLFRHCHEKRHREISELYHLVGVAKRTLGKNGLERLNELMASFLIHDQRAEKLEFLGRMDSCKLMAIGGLDQRNTYIHALVEKWRLDPKPKCEASYPAGDAIVTYFYEEETRDPHGIPFAE